MNVLLTPRDPRWDRFIGSIYHHIRIRDDYDDPDLWMSDCDGSFRVTRNIIENRFPELDVEATLDYFRKMDWCCDCELFAGCPNGMNSAEIDKNL